MSWSVIATGKPPAVAKKLAEDFQRYKCTEPEETIKQGVASIVATALAAMPESSPVTVEASGSQSKSSDGKTSNQLVVKIQPIYGFIE